MFFLYFLDIFFIHILKISEGIPYFPIALRDLAYAEESPDYVPGDPPSHESANVEVSEKLSTLEINIEKMSRISSIVFQMTNQKPDQDTASAIQSKIPAKFHEFLNTVVFIDRSDDELFDLSMKLKPSSAAPPPAAESSSVNTKFYFALQFHLTVLFKEHQNEAEPIPKNHQENVLCSRCAVEVFLPVLIDCALTHDVLQTQACGNLCHTCKQHYCSSCASLSSFRNPCVNGSKHIWE